MLAQLTPDDVYPQVIMVKYLVYVMALLVVLQICAKVWIFSGVRRQLEEVRVLLLKVRSLLKIAEKHGEITEQQKEQVCNVINKAAETAVAAAKTVEQIAAKTTGNGNGDGDSGVVIMHGPRSYKVRDGEPT
jgi:type II secretory pathway component PulC